MSETLFLTFLSESIDAPAGCIMPHAKYFLFRGVWEKFGKIRLGDTNTKGLTPNHEES